MAKEHGCEPPLPNLTPPHCRPHQLSIHSTAASPLALTRVHACCHWLPPAAAAGHCRPPLPTAARCFACCFGRCHPPPPAAAFLHW